MSLNDLDDDERGRFDELESELLRLHSAPPEENLEPEEKKRRLLLDFDDPGPLPGPIVILCGEAPKDSRGPLASATSINHTRLHRFADADALLEAFGHIRALNPERQVLHRLPSDFRRSELQHHLVILGGIGWNPMLRRVQNALGARLPIEQFEDDSLKTGELFRVRSEGSEQSHSYSPRTEKVGDGPQLVEDIALIARLRNPFNSRRTLTICNGVHSAGVLGAVLTLTDESVRRGNEEYFAEKYPEGELAMLVWVPVVEGTALAPDLNNPATRIFEWSPTAGE